VFDYLLPITMDADVINKINEAIAEQDLMDQLVQVNSKKVRLQNVLGVWENCRNDPSMRAYVQSISHHEAGKGSSFVKFC
jgi:uncharacterized protein (UPF0147 family)